MIVIIKVKMRQMMGVTIWQMLVPICFDCRVALLMKRALNW